jgi:drug/metabolite transporter (DMT)-like permease
MASGSAQGSVMIRSSPRLEAQDWALLLALSLLWGASYFFSKIAVGALPPLTVVGARVLLAAAALLFVCRLAGVEIPLGRWRDFLGMGAINNLLPFALIFWAQTEIASGLASILNATTPLFTAVLAHVLTQDEQLTAARVVGVALGIAGVSVLVGVEVLHGLDGSVLPQLACLVAAISYAFAGIFARRRLKGIPPLAAAASQLGASSLMALPIVLLIDRPWLLPVPEAGTIGALLGLALLSTALGYAIYFRILARAGATSILLVTLLIPPSTILLGALLLGERLASHHGLGFAAIALGLAAIDGRAIGWLKRKRAAGEGGPPLEANDR